MDNQLPTGTYTYGQLADKLLDEYRRILGGACNYNDPQTMTEAMRKIIGVMGPVTPEMYKYWAPRFVLEVAETKGWAPVKNRADCREKIIQSLLYKYNASPTTKETAMPQFTKEQAEKVAEDAITEYQKNMGTFGPKDRNVAKSSIFKALGVTPGKKATAVLVKVTMIIDDKLVDVNPTFNSGKGVQVESTGTYDPGFDQEAFLVNLNRTLRQYTLNNMEALLRD